MENSDNSSKMQDFKKHIYRMDLVRVESFDKTFPELSELMNIVRIRQRDTMIKWIKNIWIEIKMHFAYKKKIKELKKRDPFIYKQLPFEVKFLLDL